MSADKKPWEEDGYGDVVRVRSSAGVVDVSFANGDIVEVQASELGFDPSIEFGIDEDARAVVALTADGKREIDWMVIRAKNDPGFAREVRYRDAEEARRVGRRLRALRERKGLTQKSVAASLGMKAPQLVGIESGEQDLRLSTVRSVLRVLGADFNDIAGPDAAELSLEALAGQTRSLQPVLKKIAEQVSQNEAAKLIARGFKWDLGEVLRGAPDPPPLGVQVAFKANKESEKHHTPIERLARTLSEITAAAVDSPVLELPRDPADLRRDLLGGREGEITLRALLNWAWDHGVGVVPMSGPGFQAAAWEVGGRPVVVLKLTYPYVAYWLFALAHELGHLALGHVEGGLIDVGKPGRIAGDRQEDEANVYAKDLLVPESEALFEDIRRRCAGDMDHQRRRFKFEMTKVAEAAHVDPALLGFLAAFAMTDVAGENDRWGSATNIAKEGDSAGPVVRSTYQERVDIGELSEEDAALVRAVVLG